MKIRNDWTLTELGGDYVAVPVGENAAEFHGIVRLNETGKLVWDCLAEGLDEEQTATKLTEAYEGLSSDKALADVQIVIKKLKEENLIE